MSRMLRSTYPDPDLIRLISVVLQSEWPELEKAYAQKLIHRTTGCLFDPDGGLFGSYAQAVEETGADIDLLTEKQSAHRFPALNFNGLNALAENSAGLIDARQTIQVLKRLAEDKGAQLIENNTVTDIDVKTDPIVIDTEKERYHAQYLIIANGAGAGRL